MDRPEFTFEAKVWLYPGKAGWHFITLPAEDAGEIKALFGGVKSGFGSVPVKVTVGKTTWKTSIFPDKQSGSYVLPLKRDVRLAENIKVDDVLSITFEVMV
jgi:hypothetical protein